MSYLRTVTAQLKCVGDITSTDNEAYPSYEYLISEEHSPGHRCDYVVRKYSATLTGIDEGDIFLIKGRLYMLVKCDFPKNDPDGVLEVLTYCSLPHCTVLEVE